MGCIVITPPVAGFSPSGMLKSGTWAGTNYNVGAWETVAGWAADTANYPGSSVVSDGLVVQNTKTAATLSASVVLGGTVPTGYNYGLRLLVGGVVVATGAQSTTNPRTITTTQNVVAGDNITIQISGAVADAYITVIPDATNTFVRVT